MKKNNEYTELMNLLTRYLAGECSRDESDWVDQWIDTDPENRKLFRDLKRVWDDLDRVEDVRSIDIYKEWALLEKRIIESEIEKSFLKVKYRSERTRNLSILRIAAGFAVIALTTFAAVYFSRNSGYEKVRTAMETKEIELRDGSLITLNVNSLIKYSRKFDKKNREVTLKGEAFFDVVPDKTRPFFVNAGDIEVKVLGTSFNVNAYEKNKAIEVLVSTGRVAMSSVKHQDKKLVLDPGNLGTFLKSESSFIKEKEADRNYLSWKTLEMEFSNENLGEVIKILEKVYHININLKDQGLENCRITVSFSNQSLDAVINVLEATLDLEFSRKDDSIEITGPGCEPQ